MVKKNYRIAIAVDVMGGSSKPDIFISASVHALKKLPCLNRIILVGNEKSIIPTLSNQDFFEKDCLRIHHASEIITMNERVLESLKRKQSSSMMRAIELVKEGRVQGVVSPGNTIGLIAGSAIKLRTIRGIDRPALATIWPNQYCNFIVIDSGANPDAKDSHLLNNATLGSQYAKIALNILRPRIGLLSIGTEDSKGTVLVKNTNNLLKRTKGILNYVGLVEGFQLFNNHADVIVCDGFTGNVLLKTCESLFELFKNFLKSELRKNFFRQVGGFMALPAFRSIQKQLNPKHYAGAPLLGLKGHIIKTHGSSGEIALFYAIKLGVILIQEALFDQLHVLIKKVDRVISHFET